MDKKVSVSNSLYNELQLKTGDGLKIQIAPFADKIQKH